MPGRVRTDLPKHTTAYYGGLSLLIESPPQRWASLTLSTMSDTLVPRLAARVPSHLDDYCNHLKAVLPSQNSRNLNGALSSQLTRFNDAVIKPASQLKDKPYYYYQHLLWEKALGTGLTLPLFKAISRAVILGAAVSLFQRVQFVVAND